MTTQLNAQSFAERYRNLAGLEQPRPVPAEADDGWPLPRGGRLRELDGLRYGEHEQLFDDDMVLDAYERLSVTSPTPVEHYLFLDTETTGLAGGTGTFAFLIGLGRFTPDGFHVRQLLMRHPGDELGVLTALEREIDESTTLVTYNGRSFDMPLIETRFRLHHRRPGPYQAHLDLLPQARAVWKHRLPSCALGAIESEVLGITRDLDVPGWLIPGIYFDYLRSRAAHTLDPILSHNRHDIVSLACIAAYVSSYLDGGTDPEHAIDRCAVLLYRLRTQPNEAALQAALSGWRARMVPATLRASLLREASVTLKRQRRYAEADPVWRAGLSDSSRAIRAYCAEELAKYLEHRAGDHAQALELARQAADAARLAQDDDLARAFEHRARRLERKLAPARRTELKEWL